MKNLIPILLILLFMNSCASDDSCCLKIEAIISFSVINGAGIDLLDNQNKNAFDFDEIKVYDIIDGQRKLVHNPRFDAPKGITLIKPTDKNNKYKLSIGFNTTLGNQTTRIVQWNKSNEDIFKAEFERGESYTILKKDWANEKLVWDSKREKHFVLTKG